MAENSAISWTDHTFNAWWGCTKVGPGCDHCYAETWDKRVGGEHWGAGAPRRLVKDWSGPRKWNRKAEATGERPWVFTASMSDVFDNEVPDEWRARLFDLIAECRFLRWIIVTKRIGNAARMLPRDWNWNGVTYAHAGLVATVCTQDEADRDIPKLLATPAAWHGISAEPLLGPMDIRDYLDFGTGLDWVIAGGESGAEARSMEPRWARSLRDQCDLAGVSYHFKQWGEWDEALERVGKKLSGRLLDGKEHNGMPPHG